MTHRLLGTGVFPVVMRGSGSRYYMAFERRVLSRACGCRYVLANIETKGGVRRGDRVWQIAFGSGFKCNSAIWRALHNINTQHAVWT